jgi:peptidyl-prolyl cis-trans isomerase A (cyclophilin A)
MRLPALTAALAAILASCAGDVRTPPNELAPASFRVAMDTSRGPVVVEVTRANAPHGADRFYNMVKEGYLDGARFFRVVPGFVVQFGLAGNPDTTKAWDSPIKDDPAIAKNSNTRGTLVFAMTSDPNSRTTQIFINLGDNRNLDRSGFTPIGRIAEGMDNVDRIFSGYGESPDQDLISAQGNDYLAKAYPSLDYIRTARLAPQDSAAAPVR